MAAIRNKGKQKKKKKQPSNNISQPESNKSIPVVNIVEDKQNSMKREGLKKKEELQKFFKMEKMGLPAGAIRHKMMMENVDAEIMLFSSMKFLKPSLSGTGAYG